MVRERTAYEASDGSIHSSWRDAAKQDARVQLKAIGAFNEGTILAMIEHVLPIMSALEALAKDIELELERTGA